MESAMKRTLIRYKTRPEAADQNAGLIEKVFEELKAAKPGGVRYLSLRPASQTMRPLARAAGGSEPRSAAHRTAPKAASLLRAHGRLGDRRRGRGAGRAGQGGAVIYRGGA